jgi:hypothetical protein
VRDLEITQLYRTFLVDLGTLPAISGLRTNWDKFGSAQERISRRRIPFKEQALQKLAPVGKTVTRFKAGDALLTFFASL